MFGLFTVVFIFIFQDAADLNAGLVEILPKGDFSGFFSITVEAVASTGLSASTGEQILTAFIDPVADGVDIELSPNSGVEDDIVNASITLLPKDADGSEVIFGDFVYLQIDSEATIPGYDIVQAADGDASLFGEDLIGYYRIDKGDIDSFGIELEENWHGSLGGDILVPIVESEDDEDGDNFIWSNRYVCVVRAS